MCQPRCANARGRGPSRNGWRAAVTTPESAPGGAVRPDGPPVRWQGPATGPRAPWDHACTWSSLRSPGLRGALDGGADPGEGTRERPLLVVDGLDARRTALVGPAG